MAKKIESDAPAAVAETPAADEVVTTRSPRRGLRIAGIAAGGVLVASLLFGGGVALGVTLPNGHEAPPFTTGEMGAFPEDSERLAGRPQGGQLRPDHRIDDSTDSTDDGTESN